MKKKNTYLVAVFFFHVFFGYAQEKDIVLQLNNSFEKDINTNFSIALKNATEAANLSEKINVKQLLLVSYTNLGEVLYATNNYIDSENYTIKALSLALSLKDAKKLSALNNRLGSLQKKKNEYIKALYSYEKALKIAQTNNLQKEVCDIQTNLARLFWITGDTKNAKNKLIENIKHAKKINYSRGLVYNYNALGVFLLQKNKDSSLYYYQKAYFLSHTIQHKKVQAIISLNLGDLLLSKKEYKKALEYLLESERINKELGNKSALHYINISLGIYFEHLDDFPKAIEKYKKAITIYGNFVGDYQKMKAYWVASGVFYHSGDYKQAYLYQENYIVLKDSLFNIEKSKEFDQIRAQYEVEKKNSQIELLKKDNALETNRKKTVLIIGMLLLIPLLLLLFFYKHRVKMQKKVRLKEQQLHKKEKEKLEQLQEIRRIEGLREGEEKEKNRIARELHDGIGGKLAGIKHYLSSFATNKKSKELLKNISSVTKEVRILSHSLSSNQSLETLLIEFKKQHEVSDLLQLEISVFPPNCLKTIQHTIKQGVRRIIQELMHNVYKHSKATQVNLSFIMHKNQLVIIIEDNGVGFNPDNFTKGIGLKNVEERIKNINGKFILDSFIQKGTHITIEIPFKK